jgi:hypothetical protein
MLKGAGFEVEQGWVDYKLKVSPQLEERWRSSLDSARQAGYEIVPAKEFSPEDRARVFTDAWNEGIGVRDAARGQGVNYAMAGYSYLELVRRGWTHLSYTLVRDDNWPSRRTGERLGCHDAGSPSPLVAGSRTGVRSAALCLAPARPQPHRLTGADTPPRPCRAPRPAPPARHARAPASNVAPHHARLALQSPSANSMP